MWGFGDLFRDFFVRGSVGEFCFFHVLFGDLGISSQDVFGDLGICLVICFRDSFGELGICFFVI